jgi:Arc/MetJ-type ribon-helix-helix transcriptional regulator
VVAKREIPDTQVTLKIPRPLYQRLKEVIEGSGFHSVTEFVVYVLRDLISNHEQRERAVATQKEHTPEVEPLTAEEVEAVRKRLESLGYL